ncbi:hypothetical protein HZZ13_01255 [Bradyrhizobium sp. CNPSo 4010]|uniref:Uncharacterized protein n=1 Tax=Bradyrhizobium agreste TaxID=2751811 RepID=A0ABS0PGZ2_9BRAD|nr:hypothetical protein [Bradyrhizobium agreste]MBH5396442.1 hypothetical protein [Bradyrhizobium agreste]
MAMHYRNLSQSPIAPTIWCLDWPNGGAITVAPAAWETARSAFLGAAAGFVSQSIQKLLLICIEQEKAQAARTLCRNFSTSVLSRELSLDRTCAEAMS